MNAETACALLHNMSAPPRATITFRPAVARPWTLNGKDESREAGSASGLRWICRIDVINQFWPVEPGIARDIAEGIEWHQTREPDRHALAHSWAIERGASMHDPSIGARVSALSAEAVSDELREVARRADPRDWGLPPMALLTTAIRSPHRPATEDVRLSVTVLARTRGTIFLRAVDPIAVTVIGSPFDVWALGPANGYSRP